MVPENRKVNRGNNQAKISRGKTFKGRERPGFYKPRGGVFYYLRVNTRGIRTTRLKKGKGFGLLMEIKQRPTGRGGPTV